MGLVLWELTFPCSRRWDRSAWGLCRYSGVSLGSLLLIREGLAMRQTALSGNLASMTVENVLTGDDEAGRLLLPKISIESRLKSRRRL